MADSNQTRRDDFDGITDNDPFAELTRIMGLDPRPSGAAGHHEPAVPASGDAATAPAAAQDSFEDDFAFDLERELTGDFGGESVEAPEASSLDSERWNAWRQEEEPAPEPAYRDEWAEPEAHASPAYEAVAPHEPEVAIEPVADIELDFAPDDFSDLDLAASLPDSAYAEPEAVVAQAYEPVSHDEPRLAAEELPAEFDVEFAQDDFSDLDLAASLPETVDAAPEVYRPYEAGYAASPEAAYAPFAQPEVAVADEPADDIDFSALDLELDDGADTDEGVSAAAPVSAYVPLSDEEFHAELHQELVPAQPDVSFDDQLERELTAPAAPEDASHDAYSALPADDDGFDAELQRQLEVDTHDAVASTGGFTSEHPVWSDPTGQASSGWSTDEQSGWSADNQCGDASSSLEDELSALLSDEPAAGGLASLPPVAAAVTPRAEAWKPAVNTFGRANFPRVQSAQAVETSPVSTVSYVAAPAAVEADPEEPALADDIYAELAAFEVDDLVPQEHEAEAAASAPADDFDAIFADGLDLDLADDIGADVPAAQAEPADPVAAIFPAAASTPAAFPDLQPEEIAVAQPVLRPAFPAAAVSAQHREAAPEVETIEVFETAPPVTDDLDIPELDYGAEEPPAYDDLEAEITQAFGDLTPDPVAEETGSWSAAPTTAALTGGAVAGFAAAAAANPAASADPSADYYAAPQAQWQPSERREPDPFEYETDLEDAIGMAAYEEAEEPAPKNRRGLLLAGIAAGVLAVAGLGFFGMSLFGGGSDGPAIVRADGDPMKVRPENPGGTTVPNQDSQAYETVAGGVSTTAPEQQSLITTTEEPVDVTAQGVTEGTVLPPEMTGAGATELEDVLAEAAKSEDRIVPDTATAEDVIADEVAAVAPRRVRTMVVRPDGSMVPREEPAAAAPAGEQVTTALAPAAGAVAPAPSLGQTPGLETVQPAEGLRVEDGPVINTPDTVNVVPTPRVEPQAQAAAPAPVIQQPAAPQTPAATPASAPAAAAPVTAATSEWSMQIASQPSAEGAQQAYQDLARRYGGVLEGRGVNIVRADIQGMGTYFRVRIPASNRDEAIQLCTRYKAAGGSCFVSR